LNVITRDDPNTKSVTLLAALMGPSLHWGRAHVRWWKCGSKHRAILWAIKEI